MKATECKKPPRARGGLQSNFNLSCRVHKSKRMANLVQRFHNTTLANKNTKFLLGSILEKAFQETISDALKSEEILALAWKFQVPQFDQMLADHENHDYLPFNS